ncbi:MAG TPA: fibronectin type III domain-containing protein [Solirubrobacteraceae bacterium]|nr:fibronectin type III domain-containing protein [Solirubrobacteraceae bacterium]
MDPGPDTYARLRRAIFASLLAAFMLLGSAAVAEASPGPPIIANVTVASVTDTTATITFSIDPNGSDTWYAVAYGPTENYGYFSEPTDLGSLPGPQNLSVKLTGLTPGSTYHFGVYAGNGVQQGVTSGDKTFSTVQQVTGVAGSPVTVTDGGSGYDCPTADSVGVDWGDGSSDSNAEIQCEYGHDDQTDYTLTDTHTYALPGDYLIEITYDEFETTTDVYAHIVEPPLSNSGLPIVSGIAQQGQTLQTTDGTWRGNPTTFHYQWEDCDQNGQNCANTGDDAPEYTLTTDDVGQTIRVIVSATNDGGQSAHATSDPTAIVTPLAPSNKGAPEVTGTAQQGQTLTTNSGSWDGNPGTYDYQWQDCDRNGQNCADTGSDANTYSLGQSDVGHTVQVLVTATNGGGHSTPATSNLTAVVQPQPSPPAPNTPSPNSPPTPQSSSPTVLTSAPSVSVTTAGFSGSVTPNGLPTTAFFQYALDPRYTGGGPLAYDQSTPEQTVGADFASHTIGPVSVTGLLPNALYHVRLVAINDDGTTFGPDMTFITQTGPIPGSPMLGKTVNISPVNGLVLIEQHGTFVPLTELDQVPSGSVIDATHGTLDVITATGRKGKTQHGDFGGAIFRVTQARSGKSKGVTTLTLLEGLFKHGPSYGICKVHKAADATAAKAASKTLQLLHASAHGKFTTRGKYSAATVLGTKWTIADRCDGTLVHDLTDSVVVNDFVHHKKIVLHAGQSYLAKAPGKHP